MASNSLTAQSSAMTMAPPVPLNALGDSQPRDRWLLMRLLAAGQSVPRLADRLINERGSLGSVLSTSEERLRQLGTDSNGIAMLALIRETIGAVLERGTVDRPLIRSGMDLADSMHSEMAYLSIEQVRVAFLDTAHRLLRVEIMSSGSVKHAHVYPREIARRCLELSAAAIILVHNHPSGDPTPSHEDVALTKRVAQTVDVLDVALVDHLIVARRGYVSFRENGLI
jgi:DNA repair protein RadC